MTPRKEAFEQQARRAAKAIHWLAKFLLLLPFGLILIFTGFVFGDSSSLWLGIPLIVLGVAIWCYALWFAFVGRLRALKCPICGNRGRIIKREWDYYFHCPNCNRFASTRVGVPDHTSPAS